MFTTAVKETSSHNTSLNSWEYEGVFTEVSSRKNTSLMDVYAQSEGIPKIPEWYVWIVGKV